VELTKGSNEWVDSNMGAMLLIVVIVWVNEGLFIANQQSNEPRDDCGVDNFWIWSSGPSVNFDRAMQATVRMSLSFLLIRWARPGRSCRTAETLSGEYTCHYTSWTKSKWRCAIIQPNNKINVQCSQMLICKLLCWRALGNGKINEDNKGIWRWHPYSPW
jgi:hypothetical protein